MIPCFWKKYFEVECMGCGLQRSMHLLWKGELIDSIVLFPAGIPLLLTFIFLFYHLLFKPKNGAKIITVLFIITATIMIVSFIFKIISQKVL